MSNPNWKLHGGTSIHKQIEQYADDGDDGTITLEQWRRYNPPPAPKRARPRKKSKG